VSNNPITTPDPAIHTPPANTQANPISAQQFEAWGTALIDGVLAEVLLAIAGITIFGQKPFAGLANWAAALQAQASAALSSAANAQGSANFALTQIGVTLTSNVTGGVSIRELFDGNTASTNLGSDFTRTPSGSGSGGYGPDGSGEAAWTRSGGLQRLFLDRCNTALTTDYQAVQFLLTSIPQAPFGGAAAHNWLRLRCNSADDTFVFARIHYNEVEIGCWVSGTEAVFQTFTLTPQVGQVWRFVAGTTGNVREFVLQCNGTEITRVTDTGSVSQYGSSYPYVGCAERAGDRSTVNLGIVTPFQTQTIPGTTTFLAAADLAAAA
jgi:hypothetical protein